MAKNERQRTQNLARAQQGQAASTGVRGPQVERKREIERTLVTTRASTASMGKFDRMLEGEKKQRGVKRKVSVTFFSLLFFPLLYSTLFFLCTLCSLSSIRRKNRSKRRRA
jgi:hypothetical protein